MVDVFGASTGKRTSERLGAALSMLLLQVGLASAADLARQRLPHATGHVVQAGNVRLRASCVEGDHPVVLRCPPQIELPASSRHEEQQVVTLRRHRGRPYRQVFSWGD